MDEKNTLKCPKDGSGLEFIYEAEKLSNSTRISLFYKCPTCGYRREAERLELQRTEQGVVIKRLLYSAH